MEAGSGQRAEREPPQAPEERTFRKSGLGFAGNPCSFLLPICDGAVGAEVGLGAIRVVFCDFHDLREFGDVQLDAESGAVVGSELSVLEIEADGPCEGMQEMVERLAE